MKNKEDKLFELAKELFLKSYKTQLFFNDQTAKQYDADMKNAIKVAQYFMEQFEKEDQSNS